MRKYNVVRIFEDGTKSSLYAYGHFQREAVIWTWDRCKSNVKVKEIEIYHIKRDHGRRWSDLEKYYKKFREVEARYIQWKNCGRS